MRSACQPSFPTFAPARSKGELCFFNGPLDWGRWRLRRMADVSVSQMNSIAIRLFEIFSVNGESASFVGGCCKSGILSFMPVDIDWTEPLPISWGTRLKGPKRVKFSSNRKSTDPKFFKAANKHTVRRRPVSKLQMRSRALNNLPCHSNALIVQHPQKGHFRTTLCERTLFSLFFCRLMRRICRFWTS